MPEPLDVTTLEAGRETDALVAERLGWKNVRFDGEEVKIDAHSFTRYPMGWYGENPDRPLWRTEIPHYSTDIAAAWQVIERMAADGWICDVFNRGDDWVCEMSRHDVMVTDEAGAPLAICRAALLAVDHG